MHHPRQVFLGCGNPLAIAKRHLMSRSSLPHPLQDLANGTLCDTLKPNYINRNLLAPFTREHCNELQYLNRTMALHCLNFDMPRSESRFSQRDSIQSNPVSSFSCPTTLTSNESAHSKLYEMYLQGNSLPKYIQTRSSNKVWWLCLVPTSTIRFASDVGYRIAKI